MVNGMDSTRSGPLSTLILMLPLIVVPALVVLRPTAPERGFGDNDLSAADGDQFPVDGSDFDSMFGELSPSESSADDARSAEFEPRDEPRSEVQDVNPTMTDRHEAPPTSKTVSDSPPVPQPRLHGKRSPDLSNWGVTRSVWFTTGTPDAVGFAAFVPTRDKTVRYRFAAIGQSEQQVVRDVVRQIEKWRSLRADNSDRRANP